jgi:hypothetical protein
MPPSLLPGRTGQKGAGCGVRGGWGVAAAARGVRRRVAAAKASARQGQRAARPARPPARQVYSRLISSAATIMLLARRSAEESPGSEARPPKGDGTRGGWRADALGSVLQVHVGRFWGPLGLGRDTFLVSDLGRETGPARHRASLTPNPRPSAPSTAAQVGRFKDFCRLDLLRQLATPLKATPLGG